MTTSLDILPDDLEALKAALLAECSARLEAEARASGAEAMDGASEADDRQAEARALRAVVGASAASA